MFVGHRVIPTKRPLVEYSQMILDETPISYWRLDDPVGSGSISDTISNAMGTYVNNPTLGVAGLINETSNTAVGFTTNQYVLLSDPESGNPEYDSLDVTTFEAWIKPSSLSGHQIIIKEGGYNAGIALGFNSNSNELQVGVNDDFSVSTAGWPLSNMSTGQIYHVVGVINSISTDLKLYVNGDLKSTATGTFDDTSGSCEAVIGGSWCSNTNGGQNPLTAGFDDAPFEGVIDEVVVYDYELTETQIMEHYNKGS